MARLLIFTGANSSLGLPAAEHVLAAYPQTTVLFTVRDASESDPNTQKLREAIARHPQAKASVAALDLSSLAATHAFADAVAAGVQRGQYPRIAAIVCNAYHWTLVGGPKATAADGYDETFQVGHIAHAALVLRLLGSFVDTNTSAAPRVVLLSSDSHWPGKNAMEKYPPALPAADNWDLLVRPSSLNDDDDTMGRGYQRYATTKLAITTWMYALNEHLQKECNIIFKAKTKSTSDPHLQHITAVAVNPGNLVDSRALRTNTPRSLVLTQAWVYQPLLPLLRLAMGPTLRTAAPAGHDVAELALGDRYAGARGFYTLLAPGESSPESRDARKQAGLWAQTLVWAGIGQANTALRL